jgi:DNA modification methylase
VSVPAERRTSEPSFSFGSADYYLADSFEWLSAREPESVQGCVTDPPYGLIEYAPDQMAKRREGKGGVWRIPPSFDGHRRAPLPRFTVLTSGDVDKLQAFFGRWAKLLYPVLVPGAHVAVAANPLLSHMIVQALGGAGFEHRGAVIRLVQTMRGGDRPSMHEPWVLARKPLEGRVQDNLRKWGTGGLRRPSDERPFGDVIRSAPTRKEERALAPHPSLKPQAFLREIVRAILPLGEGIVLDTFAGSGSTLAAAEAVGYSSIGIDLDPEFAELARTAIPALSKLRTSPR